ncbi:CBS domain-containing protein, partial [bacterium]|nr:CBS domain-containing protein [bacterium]
KYATSNVHTLRSDTNQEEIIKQLIESEHNSIVLIEKYQKPVGFLSMRDILAGLELLEPKETINIIMTKPTHNVSKDDVKEAEEILSLFGKKMNKRIAIEKIEVTFEEPKTPDENSIIFNTTLIVSPVAGLKIVSKTKNSSFIDGIHAAIAQIEKQERRSGLSREDSRLTN